MTDSKATPLRGVLFVNAKQSRSMVMGNARSNVGRVEDLDNPPGHFTCDPFQGKKRMKEDAGGEILLIGDDRVAQRKRIETNEPRYVRIRPTADWSTNLG